MVKKTITYTDYNGVERTEDHYFNLTKVEILNMETSVEGGLIEKIEKITETQDRPELVNVFEDLIRRSYGVKSPDGKRFIKSEKILEEFMQTPAYSELYMELAMDASAAEAFVNELIPEL